MKKWLCTIICLFIASPIFAQYIMPKPINESDAAKEKISKEKLFMLQYFPKFDFRDIPVGSRFMFHEDESREGKIAVPSCMDFLSIPEKKKYKYFGKELKLISYEDKKVKFHGVGIKMERTVMKFECDGDILTYDIDPPKYKGLRNPKLGLIWLDEIDKARDILIGLQFYTVKGHYQFYKSDDAKNTYKYENVKITIENVYGCNTPEGNVRIFGSTERGIKIYFDCVLYCLDGTDEDWEKRGLHNYILFEEPKEKAQFREKYKQRVKAEPNTVPIIDK